MDLASGSSPPKKLLFWGWSGGNMGKDSPLEERISSDQSLPRAKRAALDQAPAEPQRWEPFSSSGALFSGSFFQRSLGSLFQGAFVKGAWEPCSKECCFKGVGDPLWEHLPIPWIKQVSQFFSVVLGFQDL